MALSSIALATVAEVKNILEITASDQDAAIEALINGESKRVENYCQNALVRQSFTDQLVEEVVRRDRKRLRLRYYPIQSVTSITDLDSVTIASTDYRIWKNYGYLVHISYWPVPVGYWSIVYTAGRFASTSAVDDALKETCAQLVAIRLGRMDSAVVSKKVGDLAIQYREEAQDEGIPEQIQDDLSVYVNRQA